MRSSENLPVNVQHQTSIKPHRTAERKSRCSSPTSNASLVWPGSDYAVHTASKMNLPSQQPPKTSGNSLSSSRCCQPPNKRQAGYGQPNEINVVTSINGPKLTRFSTQSAQSDRCCGSHRCPVCGVASKQVSKSRYKMDIGNRYKEGRDHPRNDLLSLPQSVKR